MARVIAKMKFKSMVTAPHEFMETVRKVTAAKLLSLFHSFAAYIS